MSDLIQVEHLTKDYGKGRGVFDVSFGVSAGEAFGFLGPNGAGKTTTMRHLMSFVRPDSGRVRIAGMDCFADARRVQEKVGYLPGELSLAGDMTGDGFLRFVAGMKHVRDSARCRALCDRFEVDRKNRIRKMSKGQKQKIGLVCAFLGDPEVYLLDEPTSGLDPLMQREFFEILKEKNSSGTTVFLSSHILSEVQHNCQRAAIIREGRIIACDSVEALSRTNAKRIHIQVIKDLSLLSDVRDIQHTENGISFLYGGDINALIRMLSDTRIQDLSISEPDLEEIFMHYYLDGGTK